MAEQERCPGTGRPKVECDCPECEEERTAAVAPEKPERVTVLLPVSVTAWSVIAGALARKWPGSVLVEGSSSSTVIELRGEPTDWHPLDDD